MSNTLAPVLIVGGSGIVGSRAARILRQLHPDLPIAIGGRDLAKAESIAAEVGGTAVAIDLQRRDLGLPSDAAYSAIAVFVKDDTLNSMRFAQDRGIAYVSISSGTFEIGPEVAQFIRAPRAAPILLASQWLAGAAIMPALLQAAAFETIDEIRIGVLLDEQDMGGPAAYADYDRITGTAPAALTVKDGHFRWAGGSEGEAVYTSVDGVTLPAQAYSPFDIMGLATATSAKSIRLDLAYAESASRRRGEAFSTEIVIDISGKSGGKPATSRYELVHPEGQAPLTALGVALALERLLGLAGGLPVEPGLYLPEVIIDPAYFVQQLEAFGTTIKDNALELAA